MKKQPIFQVDAFSSTLFGGNPAAVCPLERWLPDDLMQSIATENNLSETAFFVLENGHYHIRWFTPNTEVALCGHATLASAYILFEYLGHQSNVITFQSQSGELRVKKEKNLLQMDFPSLPYVEIMPSASLIASLGVQPRKVYESTFDLLCIFENEKDVQEACPNLNEISQLTHRGVILSAPGSQADVYSRCFYPGCDVPEDPVTGSAHCVIAPYWAEQLKKKSIHAIQGLRRSGELWCEVVGERVLLSGSCQLYLEGNLHINH